jgi:hypothetical protein
MRFEDKNQTLQPPKEYTFRNAETDGAYLRLTYYQTVYGRLGVTLGENVVTIYVNDIGREVGRTIGSVRFPQTEADPAPVGRRFRIYNGFLIVLQGLQEMCIWKP